MARTTASPTVTFEQRIALLPMQAREQNASGLLPPIVRAMGHVSYLAACLFDADQLVPDDAAITELEAARDHWNVIDTTAVLSPPAREALTNYGLAISDAINEYISWGTREARLGHIRNLANRAAGLTVQLDRELAGLRGSDAGISL